MTKRHRNRVALPPHLQNFVITDVCNFCLPAFISSLTIFGYTFGMLVGMPVIIGSWIVYFFHFILGSFEVFLLLSSLYQCATTSPGVIENGWDQNLTVPERDYLLSLEPQVKDGKKRFCRKCGQFKPPRAHHSSSFGKCVHRMDHFCIWVNNVVGLHNQKFFILFLVYAWISIAHFLLVAIYGFIITLIDIASNDETAYYIYVVFFVALVFVAFISPLGFVLSMFICWTFYLLLTNTTSIEHARHMKVTHRIRHHYRKVLKLRKSPSFRNIYNTTFFENVACVFGNNPWNWWWPYAGNFDDQDGIHYTTINRDAVHNQIEILQKTYEKN